MAWFSLHNPSAYSQVACNLQGKHHMHQQSRAICIACKHGLERSNDRLAKPSTEYTLKHGLASDLETRHSRTMKLSLAVQGRQLQISCAFQIHRLISLLTRRFCTMLIYIDSGVMAAQFSSKRSKLSKKAKERMRSIKGLLGREEIMKYLNLYVRAQQEGRAREVYKPPLKMRISCLYTTKS